MVMFTHLSEKADAVVHPRTCDRLHLPRLRLGLSQVQLADTHAEAKIHPSRLFRDGNPGSRLGDADSFPELTLTERVRQSKVAVSCVWNRQQLSRHGNLRTPPPDS